MITSLNHACFTTPGDDVVSAAMSAIVPPKRINTRQWLIDNFSAHDGQNPRKFAEYEVPWVTAPNGPCDAIDNPQYRFIWLQWAARCFKTTFGQAVQLMYAHLDPCSMMFGTPDANICKSIFDRFWKIIDACRAVSDEAPPHVRDRSKIHIRLLRSEIFGAWPRGVATMADKAIKVGHANEIDKWATVSTSREGSALRRFFKRGNQFPDAKFIAESTPSKRGASEVERGYLESTACTFRVPCPHCAKFQQLIFGDQKEARGVFWDVNAAGENDPELARKTAYYVCKYCKNAINDADRPEMMNLGIHVPAGCRVDHDLAHDARRIRDEKLADPNMTDEERFHYPWLIGTPKNNSNNYGSHVSVLYALFHGWGDIAADGINRSKKTIERRQWTNEDLAETWTEREEEEDWESIAERIICPDYMRGEVPLGYSVLTAGVDRQNDGTYPFVIQAWDVGRRCAIIEYGYAQSEAEVVAILTREFRHKDGHGTLKTSWVLLDSGFKPKDIAKLVILLRKAGINAVMCKGANRPLSAMFKTTTLPKDSATPGMKLINVDTYETQHWIDDAMNDLCYLDEESLTVFQAPAEFHKPFIQQLCNDEGTEEYDRHGNNTISWNRRDRNVPNDWRDCARYGRAALEVLLRLGNVPRREDVIRRENNPYHVDPTPQFTNQHGQTYLATER